ncbi:MULTISPECIES: helix-turn-helix domain-containing protein [unclassified Lentimonas]|uniref:helix-turn-helix domain-containing protein n=1 Tax=unclassified Lentimonas TaxID=2630993 RepID=UPI001326A100|nr:MULTISPECIES: helix-turn-helix domain-containing protein [unclassified Lentimonas]CAA6677358.1 Unannotated [Lentimonas sp. CC4]CAA6686903.1 Unannotated [Lentimonas sp. CC6]CAA6690086.1 Unannotated [Lentimonas sp. CC19]CAA6690964.1 Unannotated [Lentimonas sp. CC10]CAA7070696.1 Unannotated [Lentimonas sp. CC11]
MTNRKRSETSLADAILEATLGMDDGDFTVEFKPARGGKVIRIAARKSGGELELLSRSGHRDLVPEDTDPSIGTMAKIGSGDSLPSVDRDMSDVQAELHASLDPSELVKRIGLSRVTVSNYRSKGKILGLRKGNRYVFPAWQLDKTGQLQPVMQDILRILEVVTKDPIDLLILMITGLDFFKGKSIKDFLIAGDTVSALQEARMIAKV